MWSTSIAIVIVFLSSSLILTQNSEARFYGMLFALVSVLFHISVKNIDKNNTTTIILF